MRGEGRQGKRERKMEGRHKRAWGSRRGSGREGGREAHREG